MAGVNIANAGLLLTNYLLDGVDETLNHESRARQLCKKTNNWTGDHLEWRVHVRRSGATNYSEDGGAFPTANKQTYVPAKAYRKFLKGSIQLTDGAMNAGKAGKAVAKDVVTSEVRGMMRDMLKQESGFFFKDGTGSVARVIGTGTASTTDVPVTDTRMLWEGTTYDVYDDSAGSYTGSPTGSSRGTVTIASVEQALNTSNQALVNFDAAGPSGFSQYDHLVWKDSVNRAPQGLDSLIDDTATTFQNVNVATYPHYASLVLSNGGTNRDLTPGLFRQMLAGLYQKSGKDVSGGLTVITNSWQSINVEELYEGELRLTPQTKTAGVAIASFQSALGRVDILTDSDATYNKMFFADFSNIYRAVQRKLSWRRQGGSIFLRSDTAGVWTATALEICEYYIRERHTSGKIEDLNETQATAY